MTRTRAWLFLFLVASAAAAQPLEFSAALAARRPSSEEVEAQALLAAARRAAAGGASRAAEAPAVSVTGGPRRGDDGNTEADLGVALEVPLLHGRGNRAELAALVDRAANPLAAGAGAIAAADLAAAFVDVWLAQASAEVRAEDLATTEEWLAAANRRVEAGADPPYEPTLVAGERDRALVELVAARRELELAWGELAARADVGAQPRPVTIEDLPGATAGALAAEPRSSAVTLGGLAGLPRTAATGAEVIRGAGEALPGVTAASIGAREELALGLAHVRGDAARSRWALASELATEGDERLAHVGVAYRFPLRGERLAIEGEQAAAESQARRDAERARVALRARLAAAGTALAAAAPALGAPDLLRAQQALVARIAEGKERPSEVLPLRRQLLEARLAGLAARAARAKAAAELHFLLGGFPDVAP